jgi:uncharacterized protein YbbC (DUF1343 family)
MPSPNMPTLDTATVYPGMVLFEGTMVSEGRGTTRPFELVGAPYIDPYLLAERVNGLGLPGVYFRPTYFQPTFHKHVEKLCGALQVHVLDRDKFQPTIAALAIWQAIYQLYGDKFEWKQPPYEYITDKLPIDVIWGTDSVRKEIEKGSSLTEIATSWQVTSVEFKRMREEFLLY